MALAHIGGVIDMVLQGIVDVICGFTIPRINHLDRFPVKAPDTSVNVPPGHTDTMGEFLSSKLTCRSHMDLILDLA